MRGSPTSDDHRGRLRSMRRRRREDPRENFADLDLAMSGERHRHDSESCSLRTSRRRSVPRWSTRVRPAEASDLDPVDADLVEAELCAYSVTPCAT